jgi:hypothetical protein
LAVAPSGALHTNCTEEGANLKQKGPPPLYGLLARVAGGEKFGATVGYSRFTPPTQARGSALLLSAFSNQLRQPRDVGGDAPGLVVSTFACRAREAEIGVMP